MIKMDDRELDQRLGMIEMGLATIDRNVANIEAVIQQYWSDFMREKDDNYNKRNNRDNPSMEKKEEETKRAVITPKENGQQ